MDTEKGEELAEGPWNLGLPEAKLQEIRASIQGMKPGQWAEELDYRPACTCGLSDHYINGNRGYSQHGVPSKRCYLHDKEGA